MVHICSHEIVERILKIIKRNNIHDYNNNIEHTIDNNKTEYNQMSIKERIAKLIKENEKYFIYEVMRTTTDAILYDSHLDMERLKRLSYSHRIAVDIFEKYGIFIYVTDLSEYTYAPRVVKSELQILINGYGLDKVTEEIAIYLKENYPNQFGICIMCVP